MLAEVVFPEVVQQWTNDILVWIGFGTLVGLLAKAIMPGRDPGGAIATLSMGIGGTIIGLGTLAFFWREGRVTPISPLGFVVATGGAFILLFFYRLLAGRFFTEGHARHEHRPMFRRYRSRSSQSLHHDE
jgi:uncharacterized membrane protein YeaQ/YmgE (transglycosylase-associated protein family)